MPRLGEFITGIVGVLLVAVSAMAQGGATGAISGTVEDVSGALIAGAQVQIVNQATGEATRTLKTDANGAFSAPFLPVASYTVKVTTPGFAEGDFKNIAVRITETTRLTAKLAPLKVTQQIEVQAEVQSVETTSATTGQAIEALTIRELPLATQNFQQLLTLSTGVQSELNQSTNLGRGDTKVFVNGQREDNNNYQIEGISATDYNVAQSTNVPLPNPDVIGEFKVQTSLYDASQGRNGGGNINAILKSGTRTFHGDAYEFFRNDVLNANEWFLNRAGQPRPSVKQNIFGGSFGGPLSPDATLGFFFVNYQGTRQRSGLSPGTSIDNPGLPLLPTDRSPANLQSVFQLPVAPDPIISNAQGTGLLQLMGNQFPNSGGYLIPSGIASPNCTTGCTPGVTNGAINTGEYVVSSPGKYTDDQFTVTWDREFHVNDKVSAHFFFSDADTYLPFGAGGLQASLGATLASSISETDLDFPFELPINARFFAINETHLFSPNLVSDFRFGLDHISNSLENIPPVTATQLGIDRPTNNVTSSIYKFTLNSSGFQIGPSPEANQYQTQNNFNFVENMTWVHGKHSLSWGGEYTRVNLDKLFPQVFNGQLIFASGVNPSAPTITQSLTDFQWFLIGAPPFSFGGGGVYNHQYRTNDFGFYAQDQWKVRDSFTFNYGLRTEVLGAFHDNDCHIGNLDPTEAANGQYPFLYGPCVQGLGIAGLSPTVSNNTTYNNNYATGLGPRIGFAWDLLGRHTTSLRGGYGIYYVREDVGTVDQLSFQAPFLPVAFGGGPPGCMATFFSSDSTCFGSAGNPNALPQGGVISPAFIPCLAGFQGFPSDSSYPNGNPNLAPNMGCTGSTGSLLSSNIFGLVVPRHYVTPATQQWNLTLQRDLGRNWIFEVGYVGTHSVHLRETRTSLQAQNVSPSDPLTLTYDGTPYSIEYNTFANGPARSRSLPINGYSGMQLFANDAYSHYHSLQTTLSRRWGAGYFQGAYTFARSTDATSSGNTAFNTAFNDESTMAASRGLSDFDRRHRVVASYRYDLPFFRGSHGLAETALGGWTLSGITILQSGTPFSVIDSAAGSAFLGPGLTTTLGGQLAPGGSIPAGLAGGSLHQRIATGYLNPANFTTAPELYPALCATNSNFCTTAFGDLGRNIYHGPFQQNWDFSAIKNFRLSERQDLRFTADFFNLWNHPNFGNPAINDVETISSANSPFGIINSTVGNPRLIQFQLRYAF